MCKKYSILSCIINNFKEVVFISIINLFFIFFIINLIISIYSIYSFFDITIMHNKQGSKLKLKKEHYEKKNCI